MSCDNYTAFGVGVLVGVAGYHAYNLVSDFLFLRENTPEEKIKIPEENPFYYAGFRVPGTSYHMSIAPIGRLNVRSLDQRRRDLEELFKGITAFDAVFDEDAMFGREKNVPVIKVRLPFLVYSRCEEFHRRFYVPWENDYFPFDPHINCLPDTHESARQKIERLRFDKVFIIEADTDKEVIRIDLGES